MLKEFMFPTDDFSDPSKALMGCEMYCSKNNDCWGCSVHCNPSANCQWNAMTECGELLNWTGLIEGDVSQKPSILKYINDFSLDESKTKNLLSHFVWQDKHFQLS